MSSSCACLAPAKRVWRGLRARLGLRRTTTTGNGLGKLRKEVCTCEYSDVHIMWEMLSGTVSTGIRDDGRRRPTTGKGAAAAPIRLGRVGTKLAAWSRLASYCCGL